MPQPEFMASPTMEPDLADRFRATRALSVALAAPLSDADATIQSMEDASPTKWHLAHTTWFWETFLLRDRKPGYRLYDDDFPFLFNSYYEAEGNRIARCSRGMISRPHLASVIEWRKHVDDQMEALLGDERCAPLIELGIAHEQQHQELLLTDIKHALFQNPLGVRMFESPASPRLHGNQIDAGWHNHPGGIALVGHGGSGFAFDNEGPRHRVLLEPSALAKRLVSNREWDSFIADGGYQNPALWLSDGWAWVNAEKITAPLYWRESEDGGELFTHRGWQKREPDAPVAHISYYEADAFANWAGARLPTEFEWEAVARSGEGCAFAADGGNQLDDAKPPEPVGTGDLFGDCWQFTRSGYLPYPRFEPAPGPVGEYNGKFMSGHFVLKGASCATMRGHSRPSYRNFFYPHQRWQFTGLRLARDI